MARQPRSGSADAVIEDRRPPTMSRSQGQLATVYAPGALFTWEGGHGACRAVALKTSDVDLARPAKQLIREQVQEFLENWVERASACEANLGHAVQIRQTVDQSVVRDDQVQATEDKFAFVEANVMGYEPFPLAFVCRKCGLHRSCEDVTRLGTEAERFKLACPSGAASCADDWEQLDVVMVHWSGGVAPMTPTRLRWDQAQNKVLVLDRCMSCGGSTFRLDRPTGSFDGWQFECTACKTRRQIIVADEFTLRMLGPDLDRGSAQLAEINMEPVSYRASQAFYPQSDRILINEDGRWLDLLQGTKQADLKRFLGSEYGYPGRELSDAEREDILKTKGRHAEWIAYKGLRDVLETLPELAKPPIAKAIEETEARWAKEVFTDVERGSAVLAERVFHRRDWVRRYDPIRMAVEHRTLLEEKIRSSDMVDGKPACVDLEAPDDFVLPIGGEITQQGRTAIIEQVSRHLRLLGIAEMRLIRDLEVCEYSFGFTRTSSSPTVRREKGGDRDMPVRLKLFDRIGRGGEAKIPIYCLKQANEAFYLRLDETAVREWLETNHIPVNGACPSARVGGLLIEDYRPFGRFLDEYRGQGETTPRHAYAYVYTLLHTMAHQLIAVVSELSGLDLGSFGEHLFVPDLAILVYRRGTTMDLGNLSSMWRNYSDPSYGNLALHRMVQPESLRCGAETVCMMRGGACPDCVMIPENACLTRNELLSRSVLAGRGAPKWDMDRRDLVGFYSVARRLAHAREAAP